MHRIGPQCMMVSMNEATSKEARRPITVRLTPDVLDRLSKLAIHETRSASLMAEILITEALAARGVTVTPKGNA